MLNSIALFFNVLLKNSISKFPLIFFAFLFLGCAASNENKMSSVNDWVNPFIGTSGHGHTYPGAVLPFGLVQLSPDNGSQGWDWCSGYHYSDSVIVGFSHTHLSGTGIGDLCDISVMPSCGKSLDTIAMPSRFNHQHEHATPGYYAVKLQDFSINSELTVGKFTGWQRHTFPKSSTSMLRIDLGFGINWDKATQCFIQRINDSTLVGYRFSTGWAKDQRVFFAMRINKQGCRFLLLADKKPVDADSALATNVIAALQFSTEANEQILLKTGISFASIDGALLALDEAVGWDFDAVKQAAATAWENELGKVKITATDSVKTIFYTALYHAYLAPSRFSDAKHQYKGIHQTIENTNSTVYSIHSIWDTFRAANPWFTLAQPQMVTDIVNSYLAFYDQNGLLPVWDLQFNETNTMTGYHSVAVVADAVLKDIAGIDPERAYKAMRTSAMQNVRGTDAYRKYGYLPQDKHGWSVTMTLEYAFDDWCIAQVAKKLGKEADAALFSKRAESYIHLYDSTSRFFRAKNSDGHWVAPFDPMLSEHGFEGKYIEGTAWQHTFFVPHAVDGLARLMGGNQFLVAKLDSLFTNNLPLTGTDISPDISGFIGQYAHGNEPSHHIAYMYALLDAPEKTALRVREIMRKFYNTHPDGLTGNEDCGQMSAWYVWSVLGMYPLNPAAGQYILGSPLINRAEIQLPAGKKLTIEVLNNNAENIVIASATWNGKAITGNSVAHAALMQGGTLQLVMKKP